MTSTTDTREMKARIVDLSTAQWQSGTTSSCRGSNAKNRALCAG